VQGGGDLGQAHADAPHRAREAGQRGVALPGRDRVRLGVAGRDVGDRGRTVGHPVRLAGTWSVRCLGRHQSVEGGGQPRGRLGQLTERVVEGQALAPAVRSFLDLRRCGHDVAAVGADVDAGGQLARRAPPALALGPAEQVVPAAARRQGDGSGPGQVHGTIGIAGTGFVGPVDVNDQHPFGGDADVGPRVDFNRAQKSEFLPNLKLD